LAQKKRIIIPLEKSDRILSVVPIQMENNNLAADFSVSNSPSVTASRATAPYTGEAFTFAAFFTLSA
jgi:hypothetical protein